MKKIYYAGIAIILILIVLGLILLVRGFQNRTKESTDGLLSEEVAEDQAKIQEEVSESEEGAQKELPEPTKGKTAVSKKKTEYSAKEKIQSQYEYYMKQTQTVTIIIPDGRSYSKDCSNNQCEINIY